jgi:SAM-dependent methyltransferase
MPNPYPPSFLGLLDALPDDALILDVGSGGRLHPRVIGLEYVEHPNNSVQGDALNLPFADNTFDLIQSQAVLEHVTDPQRAVDEMVRVVRPGGHLYIEVAFMQPVHQAPHHYFNHTPYGLAHLVRHLEVIDAQAFGTLEDQFEWILGAAGAETILGPGRWRTLLGFMRRVDAEIGHTEKALMASGVSTLARKPGGDL